MPSGSLNDFDSWMTQGWAEAARSQEREFADRCREQLLAFIALANSFAACAVAAFGADRARDDDQYVRAAISRELRPSPNVAETARAGSQGIVLRESLRVLRNEYRQVFERDLLRVELAVRSALAQDLPSGPRTDEARQPASLAAAPSARHSA